MFSKIKDIVRTRKVPEINQYFFIILSDKKDGILKVDENLKI